MIWSYTHLYVCLSKCCLKKDVQYTRIIISNYVEIHSNFYLCNIIHYPNSAEVTCTHGTSYIRVLWKTLASEAIMRIPQLVPKDGAYEASLQPEGFSAVCLFESSKAGSVLNVLSPPNSRRAAARNAPPHQVANISKETGAFARKVQLKGWSDHHVFWMCFCFATSFNT